MSRLASILRVDHSTRHFLPKSLLLLFIILLLAFAATALAQEDTEQPETPEMEILSETVLPYGIQTVARVYAIQDAFIASGQPNTNYGVWPTTTMRMGYEAPTLQAMRALVQFDLSPIPSTAQVNNAVLTIYQSNSNPLNDAPMGFKAQYMTAPWNQASVTWNNANYLGGPTIGIGENTSSLGWKQTNVTDMIRSWVSGAEPNYGMMVTGDESPSNNRFRWFNTTEGGYRPFVDVDYTSCTDTTKPYASIEPLPAWSKGSFTVKWSGSDQGGSGIAYYNIQVSQNGGSWHTWLSHTTATSATYNGANNQIYDFRAQAVDKCGNVQDWTGAQARTEVDSVAPQASVNTLPDFTSSPNFTVRWSGTDNPGGSGIRNFDVDVRVNEGQWVSWLRGVTSTSATFTNAENLTIYEFRARATDVAGNVQPFGADAQAITIVVLQPFAVMLPISPVVTGADNVTLEWVGFTVPDTSITGYDVRYRFNGGTWILWQSFSGSTNSALFTFPNVNDGQYDFEVRATNDKGQIEPWTGEPEAFVIVDRQEPYIVPSMLFPLAVNEAIN